METSQIMPAIFLIAVLVLIIPNFLSTNKIMLEQNVKFKSKRFELKSNKVLFDKLNFTAHSEEKAEFFAKKTAITSKGFDITQNGEKINFNGKTKLIIK